MTSLPRLTILTTGVMPLLLAVRSRPLRTRRTVFDELNQKNVVLTDEDLLQAIAAANAKRAERPAAEAAPEAVAGVVYERRNDGDAVLSAKERYLQRKKQKMGA